MSDYFLLNIQKLSTAGEDWLSAFAFEHGALGISEALPFEQPEGEEDVYTRISEQRSLDVYFQTPPGPEFFSGIKVRYPDVVWQMRGEANRDWLAEWKKSFKPFPLAGNHWVVPSWCEAPVEAGHVIRIDPGMAFGTGTHETTQLVASFLQRHPPQGSCLDVGTGTGILAILCAQLGATHLAATETDAEARRVSGENFAANGVRVQMSEKQVQDLSSKFDYVLANIIDGVLVRIQEPLKARVKPGGWLVVSGIITEREKDFLSGFPLDWQVREQRGDWLLFAARL